jgi:hypothetical protein
VTTDGPRKKHRHDLGHEDHGPMIAAGTTRGIQVVLGLWILSTVVLVLWALIEAGRGGDFRGGWHHSLFRRASGVAPESRGV